MSLDWLDSALEDLTQKALRRRLAVRSSPQNPAAITIHNQNLVHFGSNDYLGLAGDARLIAAAQQAAQVHGWGSGASPLVAGRGTQHQLLEQELASFEGTPAALLFTTGYAANVGAITALASAEDAIFSDAKNHASIIDGCRLSGAQVHIYRHADSSHLRDLLRSAPPSRRRLIVTDSLFSMDGDVAPLTDLAELAQEHQAMLLVDEAHATGVFGATGRGLCEQHGVEEAVHIRIGTLSKALGSFGGFVVGSQSLIDWLTNRARGYVFSTAMPEAVAAASRAALEIVHEEPQRRQSLLQTAERFRQELQALGLSTGHSSTQIIPVILGDPQQALAAAAQLQSQGFFVPAIRPPTVPTGESLLRISLSYAHSPEQLRQLLSALRPFASTV